MAGVVKPRGLQAYFLVFGNGLNPATHVHLLADALYIGANGFHADVQAIPDFLVEITRRQQRNHLLLTW